MKIAVAGAGGMGSRFGLYLHQAGNDVIFIDGWQANIDAMRKNGLVANLNGKTVTARIPIYTPEEIDGSHEKVDLIIALTKAPQLDGMFAAIQPIISENTYVLCLLNGIGHEDILKKYVPLEHILLGVTMWTAGMDGPGRPVLIGNGEVEIQNLKPEGKTFADQVVEVFEKAGLHPKYTEHLRYSIYRKACVNATLNPMSSLFECNDYELSQMPYTEEIFRKIIGEFASVAAKEGIELDQQEIFDHVMEACDPKGIGLHYPSMYQDLIKNHRKTEIDYIDGAISRKGKQYGIATPYCDLITMLIHNKEELLGIK